MELSAVQSAIESILFAMGNSVEIDKIAEVLEVESALVEDVSTCHVMPTGIK